MERSQSEMLFSILSAIGQMMSREMTEDVFRVWLAALENYSFEEIRDAFNQYLQTESRMPLPADILKILRGSEEDRALAALIKVEGAMKKHGGYATVVFDDPLIHAVISELGGWIRLCRMSETEFVWWKKEFRERYQHHLRMGLHQDVPLKLFGIFDGTNLPLGSEPRKPEVVGDYEKAIGWVSKMEKPVSSRLPIMEMSQKVFKTIDGI